ncbi:MAG TPA: helix-turn-helix transcriptional regulator, partial [Candidatus Baltobacteraceae bacterium]|nr:helix-turn-helix transcriptional regulator [Candidatus Baltobacteraceae bacterium]
MRNKGEPQIFMRLARTIRNLSLTQASHDLRMHPSRLSAIERGKAEPTDDQRQTLEQYFLAPWPVLMEMHHPSLIPPEVIRTWLDMAEDAMIAMHDIRRANGWTLDRVARSTGINPEALDDLEQGRIANLPDECVERLERYYGQR